MAESLSRLNQWESCGVCPLGAQVRLTVGVRENPLSSRKTRWAPSRSAFFYMGPDGPSPVSDGAFVALERPALRLLRAPAQAVQELPDMAGVVANPPLPPDHMRDPVERPEIGGVACRQRPLHEGPYEAGMLAQRQLGRAARDGLGSETWKPFPLVGLVPAHHRTVRTPHLLRNR